MNPPQYAFRAQKTSGIAEGPSWALTSQIPPDTVASKTYVYSPDGQWLAYALASTVHLIPSSSTSKTTSRVIEQANVLALSFSPLSSTLFTFERPIKSSTDVHRNVKAWNVDTGEEVGGWYHRTQDDWEPIVTADETHLIRASTSDILVFTPFLEPRPAVRLKIDESTSSKPLSPNDEPALAVWLGERHGAPASLALYTLSSLMPPTTARKAFYKADKLTVKWNPAGTMALFMTHTEVDQTGKSYYGETNLYCASLDGSFSGMVECDREGPIYDYTWSPTSREFVVCYGYMPARVQLYDLKAKPIHSFGPQHRNVVMYQPQGRLLLSAGFGNLSGGVDIWDISTRNKVGEFQAPTSSHCQWSSCGRYILTATLSPRLRVDNGVKIWWCGGQLLHVHLQEELYQASFRPQKTGQIIPFPSVVPNAPEANESVALYGPKGQPTNGAAKPVGAYRPPGARGTVASEAFSRRDESTDTTPMFRGGKPSNRYVPGAPPGSAPPKDKTKKKPKNKKDKPENGTMTPELEAELEVEKVEEPKVQDSPGTDDPKQKKIRTLMKKLRAVEDLKMRQANGETLEKNQEVKIQAEQTLRDELRQLGEDT
ncbi:hypothetical protein M231_03024 [Tremella mesenterica]|uniref:Eukaryotic translation initiation factor 2A n=1 Tax=Tremella mesenterica TaxID=5217 RepID=A0A4Q1BPD9_TREME|nr:hypothetical protein M231_03024 [Tremella mesenterica]